MQDRRHLRVGCVGVAADELWQRRPGGDIGRDDHRLRARRRELAAVLRIGEESDGTGAGVLERPHAHDVDVAVAVEAGARAGREFGQEHGRGTPAGRRRAYLSASALITFSVMSIFWLA